SCGSAIDADGDTHSCFLTFSTALFFMATPWSWWTVFGDLIIRPPWSRRYFTISTGGGASPAKEKGLITAVPHPNTMFRVLRDPSTIPVLRRLIEQSTLPLRAV